MLIAHSRHSLHSMRYFFFLSHVVVGGVFFISPFFTVLHNIRNPASVLAHHFLYFLHIMNR